MLLATGQSSGSAIGLNLQTPLYIGGVDVSTVRVSPDAAVERGFTGCISQVVYLFTVRPLAVSMTASCLA